MEGLDKQFWKTLRAKEQKDLLHKTLRLNIIAFEQEINEAMYADKDLIQLLKYLYQNKEICLLFESKIIIIISQLINIYSINENMDKPEIPNLKIMTQRTCESLLELYKTFSKKDIIDKEKFYILKIDQLRKNNMSKEIIWLNEDRLDLLIYEEERRTYIEICENIENNIDNNLDQFDTEFWFNDED